jgi:hypothetical protein
LALLKGAETALVVIKAPDLIEATGLTEAIVRKQRGAT